MYEDNKFTTKIQPDDDALLKIPKRPRSLPSLLRRATKFKWRRDKRFFSAGDLHCKTELPDDRDGFTRRLEEFSETFNVPQGRIGPIGPRINVSWVPSMESLSSSGNNASGASSQSDTSINEERIQLAKKLLAVSSSSILAVLEDAQVTLSDHVVIPPSSLPDYTQNPEYFSPGFIRGSSVSNKIVDEGVKRFRAGDFVGAYNHYRTACAHGNMYAMHNIGVMQLYGQGVPTNFEAAREYFVHCAYRGLAASMSQLGYIYLYGKGVPKNTEKSYSWFKRAADRGNAYAQFQLAGLCFHGTECIERNTRLAAEILAESAAQDFTPALFNLGTMYLTGTGVTQDFTAAAHFFKRAAKQGHPQAQTNLGVMYAYGLGVPKDMNKAIFHTRRASKHKVRQALFNMGEAYAYGHGVNKNMAKAVKFYFAAAEAGDVEAEYALGCVLLRYQSLDEQCRSAGYYWMERAAVHGHCEADRVLTSSYVQRQEPVYRLVDWLSCVT